MKLQSVLERSLKTIAVTKAEFISKKTQHCHHAAIVSCKNNSELISLHMKKILSCYSVWLREVGIFSIFGSMTSHIVAQVQSMNIKTEMKEEPIDNILTLFHHFQ